MTNSAARQMATPILIGWSLILAAVLRALSCSASSHVVGQQTKKWDADDIQKTATNDYLCTKLDSMTFGIETYP
jgi:hypothetical protein